MQTLELKGRDYVVYFEDNEELSYKCCSEILQKLRISFPGKKFIGMIKGIDFTELDDEELERLIGILTDIQNERKSAGSVEDADADTEAIVTAENEEQEKEKDAE